MSSQDDWLVDPKSNRFIDTYMRGYLDMSGGHLILRNNDIYVNDGDISLNGKLLVTGDASMNSKLFVANDVCMNELLMVGNDVSLNSRLFVADDVSMNETLHVGNNVIFDSKLLVEGDASFNSNVDISGNLVIRGTLGVYQQQEIKVINTTVNNYQLIITEDISLNGKLYVKEDVSLNSKLFVADDVCMNEVLMVGNDVSFNSDLFVDGDLSLNGDLSVDGDTRLNTLYVRGWTVLRSTLDVSKNVTFGSTLDVSGATNLRSSLDVSGVTYLASTLKVSKAATLNSTLAVTGASTMSSTLKVDDTLTVSKASILSSTLNVAKASTLKSTLKVSKATTLSSTLAVTGASTMGSTLKVNDTLTVSKASILSSTLNVAKASTLGSTLAVTGASTLSSTLRVAGASTIDNTLKVNDTLTVSKASTLSSTLTVANASILKSTLKVSNATTLSSTLYVASDVSMDTVVTIGGDVSLNNKLYVANDVSMDSILMVGGDVSMNSKLTVHDDVTVENGGITTNDISLNVSQLPFFATGAFTDNQKIVYSEFSNSDRVLNGLYDISASSVEGNNQPWNVATNTIASEWISADGTGRSTQTIVTYIDNAVSTTVNGEYIQFAFPFHIKLNQYVINTNNSVKDVRLIGFKDTEFYHMNTYTNNGNGTKGGNNESDTIPIDTSFYSNLFRIVFPQNSNNTPTITVIYLSFSGDVIGTKVNIDNGNIGIGNDNPRSALEITGNMVLSNATAGINNSGENQEHGRITWAGIGRDINNNHSSYIRSYFEDETYDTTGSLAFGTSDGTTIAEDRFIIHSTGKNEFITDVSMDSGLFVGGDVSLNSKLYVSGAATMGSTLNVNDTLSVAKASTLSSTLDVAKASTLKSTLKVSNAVTLSSTLAVTGASTMGSTLKVNDTLTVSKASTLSSTLNVTKASTLKSTLKVSKAVTLSSTLEVTGASTMGSTLKVNDTLSVSKASTLSSTLDVVKAATLKSTLNVSKAAALSSTLEVTGASTMGSTLKVNDTLTVSGDTSLNGELYVNNTITVSGNILPTAHLTYDIGSADKSFRDIYMSNGTMYNVESGGNTNSMSTDQGIITVTYIDNTTDPSISTQHVQISSVDNKTGMGGLASTDASFTLDIQGNLRVTQDVSLNSTLHVGGASTMGSTLKVNDTLTVSKASTLNSTLAVTGASTMGSTLNVVGESTMSTLTVSNASVSSMLEVTGDVSINSLSANHKITATDLSINNDVVIHNNALIGNSDISDNEVLTVIGKVVATDFIIKSGTDGITQLITSKVGTVQLGSSDTPPKITTGINAAESIVIQTGNNDRFTIDENGNTTFSNDVSMNAGLEVTGNVSLNSNLYVVNDVSMNAGLEVNGKLVNNADVSMNAGLVVGGKLVNDSDVSMNAGLVIGGKLVNNNDVSMNAGLEVGGDVSLNSNVTINGDLQIYGKLDVNQIQNTNTMNTTVNEYTLVVTEDLSINGGLSVSEDLSLNGSANLSNKIIIDKDGDVTVTNQNIVIGNSIYLSSVVGGGVFENFEEGQNDYTKSFAGYTYTIEASSYNNASKAYSIANAFVNNNATWKSAIDRYIDDTEDNSQLVANTTVTTSYFSNIINVNNGSSPFSTNGEYIEIILPYPTTIDNFEIHTDTYQVPTLGVLLGSMVNSSGTDVWVKIADYNKTNETNDSLLRDTKITISIPVDDQFETSKLRFVVRKINKGTNTELTTYDALSDTNVTIYKNNVSIRYINFSGLVQNTGISVGAGYSQNTANTSIGFATLAKNITGKNNIAVGNYALSQTTNSDNIAVGYNSLIVNTTGSYNIAVGSNALLNNSDGLNNNALGTNSGASNDGGNNNTFIGTNSGYSNRNGDNNTFVGYNTDVSGNHSHSTAIGADAKITGDNQIVIGTTTDNVKIPGTMEISDTLSVTDATTLNNTLSVTDATTLNNTLSVTGATTLNNTLSVTGATTLQSRLDVAGDVSFNQNATINQLNVTGATTLNSTLNVGGKTTLFTLDVNNQSTFKANVIVTSGQKLTAYDTDINGPAELSNTLKVANAATLNNTLNVANATTLSSTLYVGNATTLQSRLYVIGDVSLTNVTATNLNITENTSANTLTTSGDTTINGKLTVAPDQDINLVNKIKISDSNNITTITDNTINISNFIEIKNNKITITGASDATEVMDVTGTIRTSSVILKAGGTITTTGTSSSTSTSTIIGDASNGMGIYPLEGVGTEADPYTGIKFVPFVDNLDTDNTVFSVDNSGNAQIFRDLTIDNSLNVTGKSNLTTLKTTGDTSLNNLQVINATTLDSTLIVNDATTIASSFNVNGMTTLSNVTVTDATNLSSTLNVSNATTLSSTLNVTGSSTFNDTITVSKKTALNLGVDISGNVSVSHGPFTVNDISFNVTNLPISITNAFTSNQKILYSQYSDSERVFNGLYDITASSTYSTENEPWHVFDGTTNNVWRSALNTGANSNTDVRYIDSDGTIQGISGEYIQITFPFYIKLSNVNIDPSSNIGVPGILIGYHDNSFNYIGETTSQFDSTPGITTSVDITNSFYSDTFRIVFGESDTSNDPEIELYEISFDGDVLGSKVYIDNGNLGVGTTDPRSALEVTGDMIISKPINGENTSGDSVEHGRIVWAGIGRDISNNNHSSYIRSYFENGTYDTSGNLAFGTSDGTTVANDRFVINASGINNFITDVSMDSNLAVNGDVSFNSNLDVSKASTLKSTLKVSKAATLSSTLAVTGASTMGSTLKVNGNVSMKADVDISGDLIIKGRIGMNTQGVPVTTLDISATDAIRIPVGKSNQRPIDISGASNNTSYYGSIRYNTTNSQFEGYGAGGTWGSLGGVINVAQTTKILAAEPNADSSNNQLTFYTDNVKRMVIDSNGDVSMGYNLSVSGAATMSSTLTVDGKTTLSDDVSMNANVDISGNLVIKGNLSVFQTKATETINTTVNDYTLIVTEDISLNGTLISSKDISVNSITVGRGNGDISTNTVVGYQALDSNTEGSNNIAVGFYAGDSNTSGSRNTYIGSDTTTNDGTYNDSTAIGYGASITASNQIVLGRSSETIVVPGDISLNGTPYAPTASFGDESNQIATTKFVSNALTVGVDLTSDQTITGIKSFTNGIDISGSTISPGELIYYINQLGQTISGSNYDIRVSINQDGTIIALGEYKYNSNQGRVQIYQYNSTTSTWAQLGVDLVGYTTNHYSGRSVSLSADGLTVAIGEDFYSEARGRVRVYEYNGTSTWNQVGTDIVGEYSDFMGKSVSLSSDGSIVAIGGLKGTSINRGIVRVYEYSSVNDGWTKLGGDIDGENTSDQSGSGESGQSVSLSSDGLTVAIGAKYNDGTTGTSSDDRGHVRVYQYNSNKIDPVTDQDSSDFGPVGWNRLGQDIDGETTYSLSGGSVSLSSDGSIVAIGAMNNSAIGYIKVYQYNDDTSTWDPLGQAIDRHTIIGSYVHYIGSTVSISADGSRIAFSQWARPSSTVSGAGAVYVYQRDTTTTLGWSPIGPTIDGTIVSGYFGKYVALSADGSTVIGGASNSNVVRTFKISPTIPIEINALNVTSINSLTVGKGGGNIGTNTAVGTDALMANTDGYVNTAVGTNALMANTDGYENTAIGVNSGSNCTTGWSNIFIGSNTGFSSTTNYSNSTALGRNAKITAHNQIMLGTSYETVKIPGNCEADAFNATSDYRIKENVIPISDTSYNIDNLRPVTYTNTIHNKQDIGLIAHEVQEKFPFLVKGEKDGEHNQAVNYIGLIGVLIHEIQQLKKRVNELEQSNP